MTRAAAAARAPESAPVPSQLVLRIAIDLIDSKSNYRKRFDQQQLEELATSVRAVGVQMPIKVRPAGGRYELVYGERRVRASRIAGVADIPAIVEELTDAQVREIQLVENNGRADVHPLEEAERFKEMIDKDGHTIESIAAKISQSPSTVRAKLRLLDLQHPGARELFLDGKLSESTALLIARLPRLQQGPAANRIADGEVKEDWQDGETVELPRPYSYREAQLIIRREFATYLDEAPFPIDDAELVKKVGACTSCVHNSGLQPDLFDGVGSKNRPVCLNTPCFATKRDALATRLTKEAKAKGW